MTILDATHIENWYAHVHFDVASRDTPWTFRQEIDEHLGASVQIGRFHERLVEPHPQWSYQIGFGVDRLAELIGWLALNRSVLDVFVHPNTGDALRDYRDRATWIGRSHELILSALSR